MLFACFAGPFVDEQTAGFEFRRTHRPNSHPSPTGNRDGPGHLDDDRTRLPAAIHGTPAAQEPGPIGFGEAAGLGRRSGSSPECVERDRRSRQSGGIGRSRCLELGPDEEGDVADPDGQQSDEGGDGKEQGRRRTLRAHRSTRIAARAESSTVNPPTNGAATR